MKLTLKNLKIFVICYLSFLDQFFQPVSATINDKTFQRQTPISSPVREEDGKPVMDLEDLTFRLNEIHSDLQKIKLSMFLNQNKDNLDIKISKCAAELSRHNEQEAIKYWEDLHVYLAPFEEARKIASRLINKVNLQDEQSVLPILNFMDSMNVPQAFDTLQRKLKDTGHFYGNHQVFMLAENIRKTCGTNQTVFTNLPVIIREISSSIVALKNKWNTGYLFYQSKPENFFTWFSPHQHRNSFDALSDEKKPRAMWQFELTGDKVRIVNAFNGNVLIDPRMTFAMELVNDEEIRLRVVDSDNKKLIGKYLVAKARHRGEQFSQIAFQNISDVAHHENVLWRAEPQQLKTVNNPQNVQLC